MNQFLILSLLILSIGCNNSKKETIKHNTEIKKEKSKSSAELMLNSEEVLFAKRDTIDRLIKKLNTLYIKNYGKDIADKRMVLITKSQELFIQYKDVMRDLYCFDANEIISGWAQNEFINNYVITLLDTRINQLNYLIEAEL